MQIAIWGAPISGRESRDASVRGVGLARQQLALPSVAHEQIQAVEMRLHALDRHVDCL